MRSGNMGFSRVPWTSEHDSTRIRLVQLRTMSGGGFHKLKFGPFDLSTDQRELRRDGVVLPLGSRALEILIYLAERPGQVIAKQELIDRVWPDVTDEEASLRVHVAAIPNALADAKFANRYISKIQ